MKIFILRHGESLANSEKRLPTQDTQLTEKGIRQATAASAYLSGKGVQVIYASPAARALQTARTVFGRLNVPIIVRPEMRDMSYGIFGGRKEDGSDEEVNRHLEQREKDRLGYRFPGGENFHDLQKRLLPALGEILNSGNETTAIVGHLYPNRIIVSKLLGMELEGSLRIRQPNDLVYTVDTTTGAVRHWSASAEGEGLLFT